MQALTAHLVLHSVLRPSDVRFLRQLLGAFLEDSVKLLSFFSGAALAGETHLPKVPPLHRASESNHCGDIKVHSFPPTHVTGVATAAPKFPMGTFNVSVCPVLLPSLPFLFLPWMPGSQKHSLRSCCKLISISQPAFQGTRLH